MALETVGSQVQPHPHGLARFDSENSAQNSFALTRLAGCAAGCDEVAVAGMALESKEASDNAQCNRLRMDERTGATTGVFMITYQEIAFVAYPVTVTLHQRKSRQSELPGIRSGWGRSRIG
jgi:hypothetical protein